MFFYIVCSKKLKQIQKRFIFIALWLIFVAISYPVKAEKVETNKLPPPPDTGSTEEDFSAGGTRENHQFLTICNKNNQSIVYLLGNKNREFTVSAYPVFWFYIPITLQNVANLQFVLTEVETNKKIYERVLQVSEVTGLIGLPVPSQSKYALVSNKNYSWSLNIKCTQSNKSFTTILSGWVYRKKIKSNLQSQLSTTSKKNKHKIYLKHNLLYDALSDLAKLHMANPNDFEVETAWDRLLTELGWQELSKKSEIEFHIIEDINR